MWRSLSSPSFRLRLRAVVSAFLVLTLPVTTQAQNVAPRPNHVKVKRGQTLSLSLLTPLDSAQTRVGDEVRAKLDRALIANGAVVVPAEWIVHGRVTKVKRASSNCRDGEIKWKLNAVTTPNGGTIKVQQVRSYPYHPDQTGDPEWVPLKTPLETIGRIPLYVSVTAFVIAFSPLLIPLGVAATEPCGGVLGSDRVLAEGSHFLYAASKDVRAVPLP